MPDYKNGQRVRVEFECVVESIDSRYIGHQGHTVDVRRDDGYLHSVRPEDVKEVLAPENWPPQIGDIWEVEGVERVVMNDARYSTSLVLLGFDGAFPIYPGELLSLGTVRLVRRRGQ